MSVQYTARKGTNGKTKYSLRCSVCKDWTMLPAGYPLKCKPAVRFAKKHQNCCKQ